MASCNAMVEGGVTSRVIVRCLSRCLICVIPEVRCIFERDDKGTTFPPGMAIRELYSFSGVEISFSETLSTMSIFFCPSCLNSPISRPSMSTSTATPKSRAFMSAALIRSRSGMIRTSGKSNSSDGIGLTWAWGISFLIAPKSMPATSTMRFKSSPRILTAIVLPRPSPV